MVTRMMVRRDARPACIRIAQRSDLDELVLIEHESNRVPWSETLFAHEFDSQFSRVYAAEVDEKIVGFLVGHVVLDEAHVANLAVRPPFRGRGIARQLMNHLLAELAGEDVRWAYLEVREHNLPARTLYQSLGFYQVALRKNYYSDTGESAVLMNLDLRPAAGEDAPQNKACDPNV